MMVRRFYAALWDEYLKRRTSIYGYATNIKEYMVSRQARIYFLLQPTIYKIMDYRNLNFKS
jgi:hypothetical protein